MVVDDTPHSSCLLLLSGGNIFNGRYQEGVVWRSLVLQYDRQGLPDCGRLQSTVTYMPRHLVILVHMADDMLLLTTLVYLHGVLLPLPVAVSALRAAVSGDHRDSICCRLHSCT